MDSRFYLSVCMYVNVSGGYCIIIIVLFLFGFFSRICAVLLFTRYAEVVVGNVFDFFSLQNNDVNTAG